MSFLGFYHRKSSRVLKFQRLGTAQTVALLAQSRTRVWGPTSGGWEWCCQKSLHPEMAQDQENLDPNYRNSQGDSRSHSTASNLVASSEKPQSSSKWAGIHHFGPYPWRCCCKGGMLDLVPLHLHHLKWWGLPDLSSLLSRGIKQKSYQPFAAVVGNVPQPWGIPVVPQKHKSHLHSPGNLHSHRIMESQNILRWEGPPRTTKVQLPALHRHPTNPPVPPVCDTQ